MNSFIWNLIEINAVVVLLFLGYMAVRNRLAFKQQRAFLIGIPFVAIATILIKSWVDLSGIAYSLPVIELEPIFVGNPLTATLVSETSLSLTSYYGIGVILISAILIFRLAKLGLFFARNISENKGKYRIYKVDGKSSFSFFNRIQITPSLSAEEQEIVLEHEIMHVDKKHSIDNMIIELLHAVFWFNPIFFFIKRELINLHEFEVDDVMYKKHQVGYMKFLLNFALGTTTSNYLLASKFYNKLTLKKRIKIMKSNNRKRAWLLAIVPVIAILASLTQCTKNETITEPVVDWVDDNPGDSNPADFANVFGGMVDTFVEETPDEYPVFSGGEEAMISYISENITYPKVASERGVQGIVYVGFIVTKTGSIENCHVVKAIDEDLGKEALRVISEMPNWIPGVKDGKNVAVEHVLPISFRLSD